MHPIKVRRKDVCHCCSRQGLPLPDPLMFEELINSDSTVGPIVRIKWKV